jgi:hypothetical protein
MSTDSRGPYNHVKRDLSADAVRRSMGPCVHWAHTADASQLRSVGQGMHQGSRLASALSIALFQQACILCVVRSQPHSSDCRVVVWQNHYTRLPRAAPAPNIAALPIPIAWSLAAGYHYASYVLIHPCFPSMQRIVPDNSSTLHSHVRILKHGPSSTCAVVTLTGDP